MEYLIALALFAGVVFVAKLIHSAEPKDETDDERFQRVSQWWLPW